MKAGGGWRGGERLSFGGQVQTWNEKLLNCLICAESQGGKSQGTMLATCQPHALPRLTNKPPKELQQDYNFTGIENISLEAKCMTGQAVGPGLLCSSIKPVPACLSCLLGPQTPIQFFPWLDPWCPFLLSFPPSSNWVFLEASHSTRGKGTHDEDLKPWSIERASSPEMMTMVMVIILMHLILKPISKGDNAISTVIGKESKHK